MSTLFGNREPLAAVTINVAPKWDKCKENTLSFKKSSSSHLAESALASHPWTEGGPVLSLSWLLLWENPCGSPTPGTVPTPSLLWTQVASPREIPTLTVPTWGHWLPEGQQPQLYLLCATYYAITPPDYCFLEPLWWHYHQFVLLDEDAFLHNDGGSQVQISVLFLSRHLAHIDVSAWLDSRSWKNLCARIWRECCSTFSAAICFFFFLTAHFQLWN